MPYIDGPVEHVIDMGFEKAWPKSEGGEKDKEKKAH
jgi:hypothetical protein